MSHAAQARYAKAAKAAEAAEAANDYVWELSPREHDIIAQLE
ncbi:MAG: hypothetical protein U0L87_04185 [Bifidobacterium adolescentis]|nr:hypothetical protein [Bifidobacterium adolescentis]